MSHMGFSLIAPVSPKTLIELHSSFPLSSARCQTGSCHEMMDTYFYYHSFEGNDLFPRESLHFTIFSPEVRYGLGVQGGAE